jgi:hypothetical protein
MADLFQGFDANTHPRDAGFESESRGRDGNASATTTTYNLKLILTGRLLLLERVSWMNPNLRRIVAIFRVVRNSDQLGPVAKSGAPGAMKWPLMAAGSTGRCNTFRELVCWGLIELGLSLSGLAIALSLAWLCRDRSVPRGRYWRSNLLVFFVRAALPGRPRVTKIDIDLGRQCQALMIGELFASVPGQRPVEFTGQSLRLF